MLQLITCKDERYIEVSALKIVNNRCLLFRINCSKDVGAYFSENCLYFKYDEEVNADESILYIPAISALITLAWVLGANLYIKELDRMFLESLNKVRKVMKGWYPKLPFSTEVNVQKVTLNKPPGTRYGLLFSGGIDSTFSYVRHRDKKPDLIMIHGTDVPLSKKKFWERVRMNYEEFAKKEGININFIETNARQFLNERLLDAEFGRYGSDLSWWGSFYHGIALLGSCAPLTIAKHIGNLLIASTYTHKFRYPWGSHPLIDESISWADVKIIHDSYELSRQEKIAALRKFIEDRSPLLRVCYSQYRYFNCNRCAKCCRTIMALLLQGIDPNKCGFNIDNGFFVALKKNLIERKLKLDGGHLFLFKDVQEHIPEKLTYNLYNSKEFFEWFKNYDLSRNYKKSRTKDLALLSLYRILFKFPRKFRSTISHMMPSILKHLTAYRDH